MHIYTEAKRYGNRRGPEARRAPEDGEKINKNEDDNSNNSDRGGSIQSEHSTTDT